MSNSNSQAHMKAKMNEFGAIIDSAKAQTSTGEGSAQPKQALGRLASKQLADVKALPVSEQIRAFLSAEEDFEEAKQGIDRLLQKTRDPETRETLEKSREDLIYMWEHALPGQEMSMKEAIARFKQQQE